MSWIRLAVIVACLSVATTSCGTGEQAADNAAQILTAVPVDIDPAARYLFYLHGAIVELEGVRPTHPEFGVYEYRDILEVFAGHGFVVISEARPPHTDVTAYAASIADQVRSLLAAGVLPDHVTVVGFSKGGRIAILASSLLGNDDLNFAFLAACGPWLDARTEVAPRGRLLALREVSDDLAGSCETLFARSLGAGERREITLDLGGGHGAFYRPHATWVDPVIEWARAGG